MARKYILSRYMSFEEYIGEMTIPEPNSGCLLWIGPMNGKGHKYGVASWRGHGILAHRLSWIYANRTKIPPGMVIRHKCDVRLCVNPSHLECGTYAENTHDMLVRGRSRPFAGVGVRNPRALLTDDDVIAIRSSSENMTKLAQKYGVSRGQIGHIKHRRSWRHLP